MLRQLSTLLLFVIMPYWGGRADHAIRPTVTSMHGVDVSHHQKKIEWDSVALKEPIDFAFVKATEGQDFTDSLFCENWDNLHRLGIRRGAYHFFRAYGCGEEQATFFLNMVEMKPGDLAPVLDIERLDGVEPSVMIEQAEIWLIMVERALGIKPIVYSNQNFYEKYLEGHFDHYPLWIARYSEERPILTTGKNWDIWQYTNDGCIEGISQKVDLNVFPGTPEMLERLCWYPKLAQVKTPAFSVP